MQQSVRERARVHTLALACEVGIEEIGDAEVGIPDREQGGRLGASCRRPRRIEAKGGAHDGEDVRS